MTEKPTKPPNDRLQRARETTPSPSGSGRPMSRRELADSASSHLPHPVDEKYIGKLERGLYRWPSQAHRGAIRLALGARSDRELGFYIDRPSRTAAGRDATRDHLAADGTEAGTVALVRRRALVGHFAALGAAGSVAWANSESADGIARLGSVLTRYEPIISLRAWSADSLGRDVAAAKRAYQHSRHLEALRALPEILESASALVAQTSESSVSRQTWSKVADAYQLATSVLIKYGDVGLATLAADRGMAAARRSEDPVAVGSSSRAVVHALIACGHERRAAQLAIGAAQRLDAHSSPNNPAALSVYGALLLRGAVAAGRCERRGTAMDLLDEADAAAARLGRNANERFTSFGPANVLLHRVNISLALGDAGQALDHARQVSLDDVAPPERRACLFIDVAKAYAMWGKHERAVGALHAAERLAPEEMSARPSIRRFVTDLAQIAPPTVQPAVRRMARRVGAQL